MSDPVYRYFRVSDITDPTYYRHNVGHAVQVLTEDGDWRDTTFASVTDLLLDARDNDDKLDEITGDEFQAAEEAKRTAPFVLRNDEPTWDEWSGDAEPPTPGWQLDGEQQ